MYNPQFELQEKKGTIFDVDLDIVRTNRIYSTLFRLSEESVGFLNSGNLKDFSFATDRMRPMLSYINDNSLLISKHLSEGAIKNEKFSILEQEIKSFAGKLTKNLKIIESAQKAMDQVAFSPTFFISNELTNAFLDNQIPLAWEFQHDLVILHKLENQKLIEALIERGQKRIFLIGGTIDLNKFVTDQLPQDVILHRVEEYIHLQDTLTQFTQKPPRRVCVLDVGNEPTDSETMADMKNVIDRGRQAGWLRFNTINRGDAVKLLDNLYNIAEYRQTSDFHNAFKDKSAVIVCPGPSLSKNIHLLKSVKGKALIICVLHAYKSLKNAGIEPDMVIHTDPGSLKSLFFERDGKQVSQWEDWISDNNFSDVPYFVLSSCASPEMYNIKAKNLLWMSPGMAIGDQLPIDYFDYSRVGGSVSHSAFDLAVEFGFKSIALIGQDLALADDGELYIEGAKLDKSEKRMQGYGETFMVKGWNDREVKTNNSFAFFANSYRRFAKELENSGINLYNCTEGGMFLDGFEHCSLSEFIMNEVKHFNSDEISKVFDSVKIDQVAHQNVKKKIRQYINRNIQLTNEINELINISTKIGEKDYHSDHDLARFDKNQNKVIKKMKQSQFFELGLQKEMYMLNSGMLADKSIDGQIGFHLDFLRACKTFNTKCHKALLNQLELISRN